MIKLSNRKPKTVPPTLVIRRAPGRPAHHAILSVGNRNFPCSIGAAGISTCKFEGDSATPATRMRVIAGFFKPKDDLRIPPASWLRPAVVNLGWCDDPGNANYNRPVRLPARERHENMLRSDGLYDICLVLDWNLHPRSRNRGSAIFLHCAPPQFGPTAGCVGLTQSVLRRLLRFIRPGTCIIVRA